MEVLMGIHWQWAGVSSIEALSTIQQLRWVEHSRMSKTIILSTLNLDCEADISYEIYQLRCHLGSLPGSRWNTRLESSDVKHILEKQRIKFSPKASAVDVNNEIYIGRRSLLPRSRETLHRLIIKEIFLLYSFFCFQTMFTVHELF